MSEPVKLAAARDRSLFVLDTLEEIAEKVHDIEAVMVIAITKTGSTMFKVSPTSLHEKAYMAQYVQTLTNKMIADHNGV